MCSAPRINNYRACMYIRAHARQTVIFRCVLRSPLRNYARAPRKHVLAQLHRMRADVRINTGLYVRALLHHIPPQRSRYFLWINRAINDHRSSMLFPSSPRVYGYRAERKNVLFIGGCTYARARQQRAEQHIPGACYWRASVTRAQWDR